MPRNFYVYILTNKTNRVLYIGVTGNLTKRIWEHKKKLVKGFTEKYNVDKLVYHEHFEDPTTAIAREKALKILVRRKKVALIDRFNPEWEDLYKDVLTLK